MEYPRVLYLNPSLIQIYALILLLLRNSPTYFATRI
jgi:hypothetical protein